MLVGYGLETSLKGMMILRNQFDLSAKGNSGVYHHDLERLAEFVPDLSSKDKAILRSLRRYLEWAGRYPSPKLGREAEVPEFSDTSEQFQIRGMDVIELARRVMGHARVVVEESDQ